MLNLCLNLPLALRDLCVCQSDVTMLTCTIHAGGERQIPVLAAYIQYPELPREVRSCPDCVMSVLLRRAGP